MGLALLNTPLEPSPQLAESLDETTTACAPGLLPADPETPLAQVRRLAAERLAAHRTRRARMVPQLATQGSAANATVAPRTARIAAAVAERYASTQSYRAFLAAEAERAMRQSQQAAQAAAALTAELAAVHARAFAEAEAESEAAAHAEAETEAQRLAQRDAAAQEKALLDAAARESASATEPVLPQSIPSSPRPRAQTLFPETEPAETPAAASARAQSESRAAAKASPGHLNGCKGDQGTSSSRAASSPHDGLTVRLDDRLVPRGVGGAKSAAPVRRFTDPPPDPALLQSLDDEIAFRHDPVFEEPPGPPLPLPANLIEFPRQLVAPRKARPRVAEGPLREETAPAAGQLRIFEVDCADISTTPNAAEPEAALDPRQWSSLWLDAAIRTATADTAAPLDACQNISAHQPIALHPAPMSRRVFAAALDLIVVAVATVSFGVTAAATALRMGGAAGMQAPAPLLTRTTVAGVPLAPASIAAVAVFTVLYLVYRSLFFMLSDATPGMRRARIALCTFSDENPTRPLRRRRLFAFALAACPFGLGLLWACLDPDRLAWHDRISRTYQRSY